MHAKPVGRAWARAAPAPQCACRRAGPWPVVGDGKDVVIYVAWQSLCCHLPPLILRFAPPSPRVAGRRMEGLLRPNAFAFCGSDGSRDALRQRPFNPQSGSRFAWCLRRSGQSPLRSGQSLSEDRLWQVGAALDHPWVTEMLRFNPAMRPVTTTGFQCPVRQIPLARRARQSHSSASSRCSPTGKSGRCRCRSPMSAPCWP